MTKPTIIKTKGTDIMNRMLLMQYQDKEVLKQYILAFVEEMDLLFEQIEEVYLGRFLEWAEGVQLDIIGKILDQDRTVVIVGSFFGFNDGGSAFPTPGVEGFADEASPTDGGIFLDENQNNYTVVPLSDSDYRRLLMAKALLSTSQTCDINTAYRALSTLLGRTPRIMELALDAGNPRQVEIRLSASDTTVNDAQLANYFGRYLVPNGTVYNTTRI